MLIKTMLAICYANCLATFYELSKHYGVFIWIISIGVSILISSITELLKKRAKCIFK
ncbi:hypothetical protein HMPREF1872_00687 [Amygdalobacter nucleatus]|uniref:Uncharacterized protein n=1 Tax=Amygdalobacter nucleatus TaxID=3029274 RepID=A0A133YE15_9FIRM|nr:hypothetical protein HMPREF1872_00687 [Amygdalobacter nucleatus]